MTRSGHPLACVTVLTMLLGLSSCGLGSLRTEERARTQAAAPIAPAARRIVQLDAGPAKRFALCTEPACPVPTRKTLAVVRAAGDLAAPPPSAPSPADPPALAPATHTIPDAAKVIKAQVLVLHFASDSATLTAAHKAQLADAAAALSRAARILVLGRTDNTGAAGPNEAIALSRAAAVRDHLVRTQPRLTDDIRIDARGLCCYAAPNTTASGRARNRRVELVFTPPAEAPPTAGALPPDQRPD